jgi:hypothetical protein
VHQPTGHIVDENQQRARLAAAFDERFDLLRMRVLQQQG